MTRWWLPGVFLLLVSCSHPSAASREREVGTPGVAFQSSPALLLEHRAELALTPEQVTRLEQLDFLLRERNVPLQQRFDALRAQDKKDVRSSHGGYMGGGAHDVHGGRGRELGGPADAVAERRARRERLERTEATLREMQDNDSHAYVQAEQALTEAQRPRARELFSQARGALLKQLDAMHYQLRKEDY